MHISSIYLPSEHSRHTRTHLQGGLGSEKWPCRVGLALRAEVGPPYSESHHWRTTQGGLGCIYLPYTYPATALDTPDVTCKGDSTHKNGLTGSGLPLEHKSAPP